MRLEMLEHFFIHFQYLHYNSFTKKALFFFGGAIKRGQMSLFFQFKKKSQSKKTFSMKIFIST